MCTDELAQCGMAAQLTTCSGICSGSLSSARGQQLAALRAITSAAALESAGGVMRPPPTTTTKEKEAKGRLLGVVNRRGQARRVWVGFKCSQLRWPSKAGQGAAALLARASKVHYHPNCTASFLAEQLQLNQSLAASRRLSWQLGGLRQCHSR